MNAVLTLVEPALIPASPPPPLTLSAVQKREHHPLFVPTWSASALAPQLALPFPADPAVLPPSPKRRYRSRYLPPDPQLLLPAEAPSQMSEFEVALHLLDFSPLESILAQSYRPSAKGQTPFHPVSMFLAVSLRRELNLSWRKLALLLAGSQGEAWRSLLGFAQGSTPSASGLRYFFQNVGPATFEALCPQFITLLRQHSLLPTHSTYAGDPEERGVSLTQDGMLHGARNRPRCELATDDCSQPLPPAPAERPVGGGRPCHARALGHEGCACDTPACQERCQQASQLDAEARTIHYDGHNHKHGPPLAPAQPRRTRRDRLQEATTQLGQGGSSPGVNVFGYRSLADRILDDRFAVAWTAFSDLYPANTDERTIFADRLDHLKRYLPELPIGEWLDDAAVGYPECLNAIYDLGALRMVEIRADPSDQDPAACLRRGYDGEGHPLCPHGYPLHPNGYDNQRRRAKWVCGQRCQKEPLPEGGTVQPVAGCPFLGRHDDLGFIVNVGRTLPDGHNRLARDIPYGSPAWKARYGRRNLSESRNGQLEGLGLKRMRSYGRRRDRKEVQLADFLLNLRTLGRLVKEATAQA